jgi:hypothetical protein
MPKYVVEGNISFYEELYKSLDEPESQEESADLCLITNSPLTENFVTLNCNHKFNYDAIYNDIHCHKKKYNSMERCSVKQKEIRCPYCRTIHPSLLPHIEGYQKVHGVNYYDEKFEITSTYNNCISDYTKGVCCYVSAPVDNITPKCNIHYVKVLTLDGKTYCGMHYNIRTREIYRANKIKEQMEKKKAAMLAKQKIKDEKTKAKIEEKMKKQEEKLKQKAEKMNAKVNKMKNENVIISSSQQQPVEIDETKCIQILKSGPNKGKQCGCKIVSQGVCGKHNKTKDVPEQQKVIE